MQQKTHQIQVHFYCQSFLSCPCFPCFLLSLVASTILGVVWGGMQLFAYSSKLPAYSGAFLLTVDIFSFFTYSWSFFAYRFSFFTWSWSFFAYSGKVRLIRALRDCKQGSLTVSTKAPTLSKKASPFGEGLAMFLCQWVEENTFLFYIR